MEMFVVFLWMSIPQITIFLGFLGLVFFMLTAGFLIALEDPSFGNKEERLKKNKLLYSKSQTFGCLTVGFICLTILFPTKGTVAATVGTYYAKEAFSSPEGQKIMSLIRKKTNEYLDAELKETK